MSSMWIRELKEDALSQPFQIKGVMREGNYRLLRDFEDCVGKVGVTAIWWRCGQLLGVLNPHLPHVAFNYYLSQAIKAEVQEDVVGIRRLERL